MWSAARRLARPVHRLAWLGAVAVACAACAIRVPQARDCDPSSAGRPVCGLQNPEDVVALPGTGWLLASELVRPGNPPGSIVAFRLDGTKAATVVGPHVPVERLIDPILEPNAKICPGPLPPDGLAPHGMDLVDEGKTPWLLLVVNHGAREAVEIYDVTPTNRAPTLRWLGCIPLPDGYAANDVAALEDGELVVSATRSSGLAYAFTMLRFALGLSVGDVLDWTPDDGWRHVDGSRVGMPNGVAVRGDDRLFVADWSGSRLVRVDRATGRRSVVALPHHPDNLSWTTEGKLLVAGQVGSTRIALGCVDAAVRNCGQGWSVLEVDPDSLAVSLLVEGDGREFGAASSALLSEGTLILGTWAGDRVLRLPVP
jgi:hypothetical protein